VDGVRGFGEDEHRAAERLEEVEVRAKGRQLLLRRAAQQLGRVPAGDEREAMAVEHGTER
jgi:hypothetical protein